MVQTEFPDVEQRLRPRIERMVISLQARLLSLYQESATAVGAASDQGGQLRQIEASQDHSVQESVDAQDRSPTPVTVSDEQSGLDRAWTQALSPTDFFADFDFDFVENIDIDKLLDPSVVDTERGHLELEF
ncbi:hypothetical protein BGZ63DRAFT_41827 [Mariannaea sp. PMI_226]|nr:hypothetical protein BGZ63DRAFT_41827 [Mariannaea sp. PMI_226]